MLNFLKNIYRKHKINQGIKRLHFATRKSPLKIVVGASNVYDDESWTPTEVDFLNLLKENDWKNFFKEDSIDAILSEHVWEHLTEEEGKLAAKNCFKFLKKGAYLRCAVLDGFHVKDEYIHAVKPGGHGAGSDDHKILYNYKTFSNIFEQAGFEVKLLEYFDENHKFHQNKWSVKHDLIHRSKDHDKRNANGELNYTSLIVDAVKPV